MFCDQPADLNSVDVSKVVTHQFTETILSCCKDRADEWSHQVSGKIEFYASDLHAADCVYHHSCCTNFRTGKEVRFLMN